MIMEMGIERCTPRKGKEMAGRGRGEREGRERVTVE